MRGKGFTSRGAAINDLTVDGDVALTNRKHIDALRRLFLRLTYGIWGNSNHSTSKPSFIRV